MAWEQRNGCGQYYTHSYREDGEVKRLYCKGKAGVAMAILMEWKRLKREEERLAFEAEQARYAELEKAMEKLDQTCGRLFEQVMLASGYHKHKSAWRQKRRAK